jgi:hypothetical protein
MRSIPTNFDRLPCEEASAFLCILPFFALVFSPARQIKEATPDAGLDRIDTIAANSGL